MSPVQPAQWTALPQRVLRAGPIDFDRAQFTHGEPLYKLASLRRIEDVRFSPRLSRKSSRVLQSVIDASIVLTLPAPIDNVNVSIRCAAAVSSKQM